MNRRSFIKAMGAITAALGMGVKEAPPEVYDHWNQPRKGKDRRTYIKRDNKFSALNHGPEGPLSPTDPPKVGKKRYDPRAVEDPVATMETYTRMKAEVDRI